jgi:hypothetical protein
MLLPIKIKQKEIKNMTPKDSPYIDHTGTLIIPCGADPQ